MHDMEKLIFTSTACQTVTESPVAPRQKSSGLLFEDIKSAPCTVTGEHGDGQDLPVESATATGNSSGYLMQTYQKTPMENQVYLSPCADYSYTKKYPTSIYDDDENDVWAKLVAMQLKKMHPYEAAKLRLQIDSVILEAKKPKQT